MDAERITRFRQAAEASDPQALPGAHAGPGAADGQPAEPAGFPRGDRQGSREETRRVDVRKQPLVVRDGCAPDRIPSGRWPSDDALVRSEQFAVNEALRQLADDGGLLAVHAPPGTGVAGVFGDLAAAIITERARRIADLTDPAAAFCEPLACGTHSIAAPAAALTGFEIVMAAPEASGPTAHGLPPIGTRWRDAAATVDYFASTARLADGVGAWAMLAARLGDGAANRSFAARWWRGIVRGTDVLFPAGESMAAALRRLKENREAVNWPAAVATFRSAAAKAESLAAERARVAASLTRLSALEQACEVASCTAEAGEAMLADLSAREPLAREAVLAAEENRRTRLAELGAHELDRPAIASVTEDGRAALRAGLAAARKAVAQGTAEVARLAAELGPLAEAVAVARQRWGDHVPDGPSQDETEDAALIEWRETSAPWADEEYAAARAEVFLAALELHKALITARADVLTANLGALMELLCAEHADNGTLNADSGALRAAWQSFFLVVPVVHVPFEAAGALFDGAGQDSIGWLLAGGAERLPPRQARGILGHVKRAVLAGDTVGSGDSAQGIAERTARFGTWLPSGWVGTPLRVVRGVDRAAVDLRNDLGYDGLLVSDRR